MRVKRYVVDTLPDALNKIRQELGKDAVILNTKQLRVGGFLGMFSKKKIEVIAAIDGAAVATASSDKLQQAAIAAVAAADKEDKRPSARPLVGSSAAAQAYRSVSSVVPSTERTQIAVRPQGEERLQSEGRLQVAERLQSEERLQPVTQAEARPAQRPSHRPTQSVEALPTDRQADADHDDAVELFKQAAAKSIQEAAARRTQSPSATAIEEPAAIDDDQQSLINEIKEMKELVSQLSQGVSASSVRPRTPLDHIGERLLEQDVQPQLVTELKELAMQANDHPVDEIEEETATQLLRDQLMQLFDRSSIAGIAPTSRIIQFVGPTGVGKTTTIAKLAAEQVLKHNKKVGFITSDTYRIAAIDQLKTYATILNVPVEVVFTSTELEEALVKLSDKDLIFMDTAGRNYRDEASVSELYELLGQHGDSETYIVLSLVSKYNDLKAILNNFQHFHLDKVLWTKRDETTSLGSIINVLHEYALPLSYITHGQNVPDDISILQPDQIVDQLLGVDSYE